MDTGDYVDLGVDVLFAIDILVNFVSAYEDPISNLPIISLKRISLNYLTGWFAIDVIAVAPFQLLEDLFKGEDVPGSELKLARLARLPRLYRLIRIMRMIKMLRIFRKSQ